MSGKLLTIVLLGLSLVNASPIVKRSVATDITTITSDVQKLDSDVTSWDGSLLTAIPLLSDVTTIKNDINTAITDTKSSSAFSSSDSTTVTNEIVALQPIIATTLNDLVAKVSFKFLYI
jgi:hypothetical protein